MTYSLFNYTGDGVNKNFSVAFPYIDKSHVKVLVNGIAQPTFTWLTSNLIQLPTAPAAGATVKVYRDSSRSTKLVDFANASTLTESDLDTAFTQSYYIAQEAFDWSNVAEAAVEYVAALNAAYQAAYDAVNAATTAQGYAADAGSWASLTYGYMTDAQTYADSALSFANVATTQASLATDAQVAAAASASAAATSAANAATSEANAASTLANALVKTNNLSDVSNKPNARVNLGLGSAAVEDASAFASAVQGSLADSALQAASNLADVNSATTALSNLGGLPKAGGTMTGSLAFSGTGLTFTAMMNSGTIAQQFAFQTNQTNGQTNLNLIPNGTNQAAIVRTFNNSDRTAALGYCQFGISSTAALIDSAAANGGTALPIEIRPNSVASVRFDTLGNKILNPSGSNLATNATDGFPYLPTCAGTPTGTPTTIAGNSPVVIDITNKIPYFWTGSAWATFLTGTGGGATPNVNGMIVAAKQGLY